MAFFALSGITGCLTSGETSSDIYAVKYNDALIVSYYKKDFRRPDFVDIYSVVCVFGNHNTPFQFYSSTDRDTFYNTLPV